ncbi:MAG: hypothetical protein AB2689_05410 [Candidatus Thiodiazotropha taylori]
MDKDELLKHLKGIHGVTLDRVDDIDPELVRSFLDHEDDRVAANAVFLARLYPREIAVPIFEAALNSDREVLVLSAASFTVHLQDIDAERLLEKTLMRSKSPPVLRAALRSAARLKLEKLRSVMKSAYEKLPEGGFKKSSESYLDLGN